MSNQHTKEPITSDNVVRPLLKIKRPAYGSQREVAAHLGITETYLRHLENAYADPSPKLMFRIGHYFGESVYNLFPDLADPEKCK